MNDQLQQQFIHGCGHRSRLILDLDSTVVTVFGHKEQAEVGYNPRYRGKRWFQPLTLPGGQFFVALGRGASARQCGHLGEQRRTAGKLFTSLPPDVRELRVRADAGFGYHPVLDMLEARPAQYAVVARMTAGLKRKLGGLRYERCNPRWEIAELELRPHGWSQARRFIVARRRIEGTEPEPTLFNLNRYLYRAWVTNLPLTPAGVWHFYDGRAGMEPRQSGLPGELRAAKNPHRRFCRQRTLPGSHSLGPQLGDLLPADLPAAGLARPHSGHVAL